MTTPVVLALPPVVEIAPTGVQGPRGNATLSGARAPQAADGIDGDYWFDTTNTPTSLVLYGPKTASAWPSSGVTLQNTAGYLPLTGGTMTGPLVLHGANLTVQRGDNGGAYQLRVTGGALDFEIGGMDVIVSVWSGADFTGTQTNVMRWEAAGPHLIGRTQFGTSPYDTVFDLDAAGNKLGLFGHASAAKQTVTGAKGGNAALTSLIAALAAYGLITDNTT